MKCTLYTLQSLPYRTEHVSLGFCLKPLCLYSRHEGGGAIFRLYQKFVCKIYFQDLFILLGGSGELTNSVTPGDKWAHQKKMGAFLGRIVPLFRTWGPLLGRRNPS